jgi:hypothetical protein
MRVYQGSGEKAAGFRKEETKMTITEKLYMMESMKRRNEQRVACMKMAEVTGNWRKTCKYGNTYLVRVDSEYMDELHKRGCTIADMVGWSAEDALRKLNDRLEPWNIKVTTITKSILSA